MSTTTTQGKAIVAGYEWRQRLRLSSAYFPNTATFTAQVRANAKDSTILATMTTAGDAVEWVDARTIDVVIAGATSANWRTASVTFDVVRTDTATPQHLGFSITVPVVQPVTKL